MTIASTPDNEEGTDNFSRAAAFAGITPSQGMQFHMYLQYLLGNGVKPGFLPPDHIVDAHEKIDKPTKEREQTLLPCPFCGAHDLKIIGMMSEDEPRREYAKTVMCCRCHAHGRHHDPIGWSESNRAAIESWNDRSQPSDQPTQKEAQPDSSSISTEQNRDEFLNFIRGLDLYDAMGRNESGATLQAALQIAFAAWNAALSRKENP